MKTKTRHIALLVAALGLLPLTAQAHRTWLLPSATVIDDKDPWVTFDAAVSENLFDPDTNSQKLDGLTVTGPDGAKVVIENAFTGKLRSSFDIKLAKPGTYKVSLVIESVLASYKLNGEPKRWRGPVDAMAKEIPAGAEDLQLTRIHNRQESYVTAGKANDTAIKPTGVGLEMQPVSHPNDLAPGASSRVRFLLDGKPAANLGFSVVPGGVRYRGILKEIRGTTNEQGEATITWPEAGMYWVSASTSTKSAGEGGKGATTRRNNFSATLEVLPQ